MSTKLSSATALHEVRPQSVLSTAATGSTVSRGGPQAELGAKVTANAQSGSTRVLYYVSAAGDAIQDSGPLYQPAATDVAVTVPEGSGDQTWVYVQAGAGAIDRGDAVALINVAPAVVSGLLVPQHTSYEGVITTPAAPLSANLVAGVAQHNIPALNFGWLLTQGVGVALCTAALGADLIVDATGAGGRLADVAGAPTGARGLGVALIVASNAVVAVKLDI